MRLFKFTYKRIFRNTALAALTVGILPAYAQITTGGAVGSAPLKPGVPTAGPRLPIGGKLPAKPTPPGASQPVQPIAPPVKPPVAPPTKPPVAQPPGHPLPPGNPTTPNENASLKRAQMAHRLAMMRNSPGGKVDWNAYKAARKQIAKMPVFTFGPTGGHSSGGDGGRKGNAFMPPTRGGARNSFAVKPPAAPLPAYATWDYVGPFGMTANGYYGPLGTGFGLAKDQLGAGVFTGRVNAAAFDPTNSQIIYIATPGGGIHKTVDGGQTWVPLTDSLLSGNIPVGIAFSSITVDPNNPQVLYAGSGDYDGTVTLGSGLYKSTNGGQSWTQLTGLFSNNNVIRKVVVDPKNSLHLYAALGRDQDVASIGLYAQGITVQPPFGMVAPNVPTGGIYSSNDGGATWVQELDAGPGADFSQTPGYVSNIVYNSDATMLYASVDFRGVYRKEEVSAPQSGWIQVPNLTAGPPVTPIIPPNPVPNIAPITERVDVAASPNNPNTAYFLIENRKKLSVTNDRGGSSTRLFTSISDPNAWSQSYFDFTLAVGSTVAGASAALPPGTLRGLAFGLPPGQGSLPQPPIGGGGAGGGGGLGSGSDIIYIGLHDLYKSVDGGQSFTNVNTVEPTIHTEQHNIIINPNNLLQMLVANDGGIYEGTYDPAGDSVSFADLNGNLGITEVLSFASHPTDNNSYLFANNNNAQFYADGDLTLLNQLLNGSGTAALINPVEPLSQYLLIQAPASATDIDFYSDFDDKWASITGAGAQNPLPITALLNYVPYPAEVSAQVSPDLRSDATPFTFAANPQFLYSAKHDVYLFDDSTRYSAAVAGVPAKGTWTKGAELIPKDALLKPNYLLDFATAINANSTVTDTMYVGTAQGALYYSTNRGAAVIDIGSQLGVGGNFNLPKAMITGIASNPLNPNNLYVTLGGTSIGTAHVWRCDDITAVPPRWLKLDGGTSTVKLPDIPLTGITLLPRDDGQSILVSSEVGLFYSYNGGSDWTVVNLTPGAGANQVLPSSIITQMDMNASTGELNVNAYGRGIYRSLVGLTQPVSIQLNLQFFQGVKSNLTAKVDLFHTGQNSQDYPKGSFAPIISYLDTPPGVAAFTDYFGYNATPVEQHFVTLSPSGFANFNITGVGSYDFYIHIPGYLRRKVVGLNTSRPINTNTLLFAGDVNNDNIIDVNDIIAFNMRFVGGGGFTNPLLDVNGDGVIDGFDYAIIVANQGRIGD